MSLRNTRQGQARQGLYDPALDHDACGVGFVAHLGNEISHDIILKGIQILENLEHRGATGADPRAGDGAGMLVQIPHDFLSGECDVLGFELPESGQYGVGQIFMPQDEALRDHCREIVERAISGEGHTMLGWRDVPVDNSCLSQPVIETEPVHMQVFIGRREDSADEALFERHLYLLRKVISNTIFKETEGRDNGFYIVSMSCRTLVYKGMFLADQLGPYYKDLSEPRFVSRASSRRWLSCISASRPTPSRRGSWRIPSA
jgi:glutamate synthase (NADPH/NADH) large chain